MAFTELISATVSDTCSVDVTSATCQPMLGIALAIFHAELCTDILHKACRLFATYGTNKITLPYKWPLSSVP